METKEQWPEQARFDTEVERAKEYFRGAYCGISPHMFNGLLDYLAYGVPPGSFLQAVLKDELVASFATADSSNCEALAEWAKLMFFDVPNDCRHDAGYVTHTHNGLVCRTILHRPVLFPSIVAVAVVDRRLNVASSWAEAVALSHPSTDLRFRLVWEPTVSPEALRAAKRLYLGRPANAERLTPKENSSEH